MTQNKTNKNNSKKTIAILAIIIAALAVVITAIISYNAYLNSDNIELFNNPTSQLSETEKAKLAHSATMSDIREDYNTDRAFANFRALKGGNIKENYIFRGASPYLDNSRTYYVNKFLERYSVKNVISLSENTDEISKDISVDGISDMYFAKSLKNGTLYDQALDYVEIKLNNKQDVKKIIDSYKNLNQHDGNIYVHCAIGRDRTGTYCILLECLAGFTYQEIVDDYMKSWENYSYITKEEYPDEYNRHKNVADSTLMTIYNNSSENKDKSSAQVDLSTIDLKSAAISFLLNNGASKEDLDEFINKICVS